MRLRFWAWLLDWCETWLGEDHAITRWVFARHWPIWAQDWLERATKGDRAAWTDESALEALPEWQRKRAEAACCERRGIDA